MSEEYAVGEKTERKPRMKGPVRTSVRITQSLPLTAKLLSKRLTSGGPILTYQRLWALSLGRMRTRNHATESKRHLVGFVTILGVSGKAIGTNRHKHILRCSPRPLSMRAYDISI